MDEAAAARLAHLEKLLEHANVGVVQTDAPGRMVAVNPCWCAMLGYTEQEMLRLSVADVTHPESLPETLKAVHKLAAGGPGFRIDKRYLRKDGSTLWARSSVSALRDAEGAYQGLLAIVVDISDRKRAQDALQASEAQHALMLALGDALRTLSDPAAIQMEAARVLGEHLGASRVHYAELEPQGDVVVHRSWCRGVADLRGRHSRASFGMPVLAELQAGRTLVINDVRREPRLDAALRATWAALDIAAAVCVPLVKDGRLLAALSVHQRRAHAWSPGEVALVEEAAARTWDAVERARAEAALKESQQQLSMALDAARMGAFDWDPETDRLVHTGTSTELFGLRPDSPPLTGQAAIELIHPEDRERHRAIVLDAIRDRKDYRSEYRVIRPRDGRMAWMEERGSTARDPETGAMRVRGVHWDVSARREAERALRESEATLRATFEQAAVGIVHVGQDGRFLRVNRKFCEMLDYEAEALGRMSFFDIAEEEDREKGLAEFRLVNAGKLRSHTAEKRYRRRDGSTIWVRVTASAVDGAQAGAAGASGGYHLALVEDITEQRQAEQRARDAAQHDPLTRLPNRRLVFEYAEHLLAATARRHSQGAFLFIDLDRFKPVNDLYGHEVGDRLLEEVARRLLACVRHEDLVGRLGGDEFVIVLPYLDAPHHAVAVAHHVIERISAPVQIRELTVSVSPSIGISHFPQHGLNADALIRAADLAMYRAKQAGAGGYEVYTPELAHQAHHMSLLEARLKRAMLRPALELHYQPVMDLKTNLPSGAEALLRIVDDEGPPVSPARFIPVAEAAGLIGQLGEWVAAEACRQHLAWRARGLPPIPIAINVSPLQFRQPGFATRLCDIVRDSGIDPGCFQIEVTESTVMDNVAEGIEKLRLLRAAGIKVALDDFGTGYSSLSHLSQLPLDRLKVDQSFVKGVSNDRISRAITDAVIALGRTLELEVVGEGIESEEARAYLLARGCDKGQGYFFSRPLRQEEFAGWYGRSRIGS